MEWSQEDHLDMVSENTKSTLGHANEAQSTLGRKAPSAPIACQIGVKVVCQCCSVFKRFDCCHGSSVVTSTAINRHMDHSNLPGIWHGLCQCICERSSCGPTPPLRRGEDLQISLHRVSHFQSSSTLHILGHAPVSRPQLGVLPFTLTTHLAPLPQSSPQTFHPEQSKSPRSSGTPRPSFPSTASINLQQ